VEKGKVLSQN